MHYGALKPLDIANGHGVRVSLFVSGCRNHCEGCFQPETWSFDYGKEFDFAATIELLEAIKNPHVQGLSILGGDPLEPENREKVFEIIHRVKFRAPEKTIWMWTGYLWEDLWEQMRNDKKFFHAMERVDVLVDGPFVKDLKDFRLKYRGSSNQRVIDVKASMANRGKVIEYED